MVQQLFEVLFLVSLIALVASPVVGALFLVWPRRNARLRPVQTSQVHARA
jgi:hypothetical protein